MDITRQELEDYLIEEQGFDENEIECMDTYELLDLYEMYHED